MIVIGKIHALLADEEGNAAMVQMVTQTIDSEATLPAAVVYTFVITNTEGAFLLIRTRRAAAKE